MCSLEIFVLNVSSSQVPSQLWCLVPAPDLTYPVVLSNPVLISISRDIYSAGYRHLYKYLCTYPHKQYLLERAWGRRQSISRRWFVRMWVPVNKKFTSRRKTWPWASPSSSHMAGHVTITLADGQSAGLVGAHYDRQARPGLAWPVTQYWTIALGWISPRQTGLRVFTDYIH